MNRRQMLKAALLSPLALIAKPQGCDGDCARWCELEKGDPSAHQCSADCPKWEEKLTHPIDDGAVGRGHLVITHLLHCALVTPPPPGVSVRLGGRS